jgi:L-amino acid N-acyltransferase YncA
MEAHRGLTIRPTKPEDVEAVWSILEQVIRGGEVFALPRDLSKTDALAYWFSPAHEVFAAVADGHILGAYYLRANHQGGGSHVANCGYMTSLAARGRGVASAMCRHSLDRARSRGFRAMQFNFVISSNEDAVHLWKKFGFRTVGILPKAFSHPSLGLVDALVMFCDLP